MRRMAFGLVRNRTVQAAEANCEITVAIAAPLNSHTQCKNKKGIENYIQHSADERGDHTHPGKALGIDIAVHSQAYGDKDAAQQVNGKVAVRKGKRSVTGAEGV